MKKYLLVLSAFLCLLLVSQEVGAYDFYGSGYKNTNATTGRHANPALNGVVYNGTTYNFNTHYVNARNRWNNATDVNVSSGTTGTIAIRSFHGDYGNNDLFGWARMYKSDGTTVQSCATCEPTANWAYSDVYLNQFHIHNDGEGGDPWSPMYIDGLATHEFGHAYGLAHEDDVESVMHSGNLYEGYLTPRPDDISGMNALH
ncbi:matrixin family metalloprotease (plasmid) [Paenibacillus urinalis]|nr:MULTISPECIES: matrixin family metalloprotease [Paenibacillus]MCM3131104.1 matrixin family metalloprotease [Paenibacillus sp. MER 78]WDH95246.1 matrixin family metalloprotease [Paenibacillus urinalis]WDI05289.1 matrixin family metalloprotease [Paenibacillus urinalis]